MLARPRLGWLALVGATACGPRSDTVAPRPPRVATVDVESPQRVLRLAARCPALRGEATPIAWRREGRTTWRVQVRWPEPALDTHPRDVGPLPPGTVQVDPVAGTCEGQPIAVAPTSADVPIEAIIARAERCSGVTFDRATVRVEGALGTGRIVVDPQPGVFDSLIVQIDAATGACSVDRGGFGPLAVTEVPGPSGFAPWRGL